MIVRLKQDLTDHPFLKPGTYYFVIGIEANDYRILDDQGRPYLYPAEIMEVVDPQEPIDWVTEYGDEGERYAYPPALNREGFFEDYFEGDMQAVSEFWHVVNQRLTRVA